MAFQWKDRYNLGIEEVDRQHKRLFALGARVYDLTMTDDGYDHYDELNNLISELLDYTEYHFKFEESFLTEYGFPAMREHLKEHIYFVAKIKSISARDIDNGQKQALQDLVDFLSEWISSHIILEDRKYAAFLKEKGIELKRNDQ